MSGGGRYLLDSSFVIDLMREMESRRSGPALAWLRRRSNGALWLSPVTLAEVLEGVAEPVAAKEFLARFHWQVIGHQHAECVALRQQRAARRLGENDAWQVAVAECMDAVLVGHDPAAFARLGDLHEDHRAAVAE